MGLDAVLSTFSDIEVVATFADGLAFLDAVDDLDIDVALIDIRMPGIDGLETIRRLREAIGSDLAVAVLTTFEHEENVMTALQLGADGFLNKSAGPDELAAALRALHDGGGALSPGAAAMAIANVTRAPAQQADPAMRTRFEALTPREAEIVAAVMRGDSYDEIGGQLFLSPLTVKTHANRAMGKVGARDRAQLIAFGHRAGLQPG